MNIGIVIGVSEYTGKPGNLPSCKMDADYMGRIMKGLSKFDEVLIVSDDTKSVALKEKLIEFINGNKEKDIEEVFFYYSGHGEFSGDEFFYLLSDFDSERKKQTCLENSELDNLLRSINPKLTIKVVDACQSGVSYIKDVDTFGKYLKGTQETFKHCYFLFSSMTEQSSYQDDKMSFFTRSFIEAIIKHSGSVIRYKDIIDYISDSFAKESGQTPFFIVQADFTDQFCCITDALREVLKKSLTGSGGLDVIGVSNSQSLSLLELVKEEAKDYCTEEEVKSVLTNLIEKVKNTKVPQEALELFEINYEVGIDYNAFESIEPIAKWLHDNEHKYFAKPIFTGRIAEEPAIAYFEEISGTKTKRRRVIVPVGVRPTIEMPLRYIMTKGKPKFPNLQSVACIILPIVSQIHVRFFIAFSTYRGIGWDKNIINEYVKWLTREVKLKDDTGIVDYLSETSVDFWEFVLEPIKDKFGLLPTKEASVESKPDSTEEKETAG